MKLSESVKSISYLKTHASEIVRDVFDQQKTLVITQNGEAKVIVQDVKIYEQTKEALALLKILALSGDRLRKGKHKPLEKAFSEAKSKAKKRLK